LEFIFCSESMTAVRRRKRKPQEMSRRQRREYNRQCRLTRERVARCVERREAGRAVARVEYDGAVLDMLVRLGWLVDGAATDGAAVGRAITALIADSAKNF
jgi:hypothetical protein